MVVMKIPLHKCVVVVTLELRTPIILILLSYMLKFPLMVLPVLSYQVNSQLALQIVMYVILILFVTVVLLDSMHLLKLTYVILIRHLFNTMISLRKLKIVHLVVKPVLIVQELLLVLLVLQVTITGLMLIILVM